MFVELHILQNFAPSNLNRDDTGSPKDCEFGGYRRARISSQCLKRAIRTEMRDRKLIPATNLGSRTKRLVEELVKRLEVHNKAREEARTIVEALLQGVKLTVKDDGKTQYLLFLGQNEINAVANLCLEHWDRLAAIAPDGQDSDAPRSKRDTKKAGAAAIPGDISAALKKILDGGKAADVALFGRMLADLPDNNVEAACQVAHAISTNKVSIEFDFYTAVDDLKPEDTAGADMLGTVEFNSACFYRYANVDVDALVRNLGADEELVQQTLEAFLRASIDAVPTGKQNSMAAHNKPSLVFVVVRKASLWSLSNAFIKPIRPDQSGDRDLVHNSIAALDNHWSQLTRMYGDGEVVGKWACALDGDGALTSLTATSAVVNTVDEIIGQTLRAVSLGGGAA